VVGAGAAVSGNSIQPELHDLAGNPVGGLGAAAPALDNNRRDIGMMHDHVAEKVVVVIRDVRQLGFGGAKRIGIEDKRVPFDQHAFVCDLRRLLVQHRTSKSDIKTDHVDSCDERCISNHGHSRASTHGGASFRARLAKRSAKRSSIRRAIKPRARLLASDIFSIG
jgi:hypothetical protein